MLFVHVILFNKSRILGAKPVYELKKKEDKKPKLEIKNSSRKQNYDLVFEDSGDESDKERNLDTRRKEHKRKRDSKVNEVYFY